MSKQRFESVWDAIEDTPAEAEKMKLRSALMMALEQHIKAQGWSQAEAARLLDFSGPVDEHVEQWLTHMHAPTGLDLGAEAPAAVALSILAEVQQALNHGTALPLKQVRATRAEVPQP